MAAANPLQTKGFQRPVHHRSLPVTAPDTRRRQAATVRRLSPHRGARADATLSRGPRPPVRSAANGVDEVVHDDAYGDIFARTAAAVLDLDGAVGEALADHGD